VIIASRKPDNITHAQVDVVLHIRASSLTASLCVIHILSSSSDSPRLHSYRSLPLSNHTLVHISIAAFFGSADFILHFCCPMSHSTPQCRATQKACTYSFVANTTVTHRQCSQKVPVSCFKTAVPCCFSHLRPCSSAHRMAGTHDHGYATLML